MMIWWIRRYSFVGCLALYAAVLVGLHIAGLFPRPGLYDVSRLIGAPSVALEGRIVDFPITRWNQTRFLFEAEASPLNAFRGRVSVTLRFPRTDLGPGDRLRLRGWLSAPRPASLRRPFDEKRYWEGMNTFALFKVWSEENCQRVSPASPWAWQSLAWAFQKRFRSYWEQRLPSEEAGLLLGVTIGGRGRLSAELKNACIRAGVYHIMVVSGQNVALIILLAVAGLRLLSVPVRHGLWICALPLMFYAAVVGADPPVLRAVAMALAVLTVSALGRDVPRFYPFSLAAGWILLADPCALFGASFQLSFGATASLLALLPILGKMKRIRPACFRWLVETAAVSLAVTLGVWPLLVYYFHRLSLIGLAANGAIFPLSGILMVLGLVIGALGMYVPAAAPRGVIQGMRFLTHGTLEGIHWLSRPRWAAISLEPPGLWVFGVYYAILFGILFTFHRRKIHGSTRLPENAALPTRRSRIQSG